MKIDRFYNTQQNSFTVTSEIIKLLEINDEIDIDFLFSSILSKSLLPTSELLFESLGLLYLTDKIELNLNKNLITLKK